MNDILADFYSSNDNDILLVIPCEVNIKYYINESYNSKSLEHNIYVYSESITKVASDYAAQYESIISSIIQDTHDSIIDSVQKTDSSATVKFTSDTYSAPNSISVVSNENYAFIYTSSIDKFTVISKTYKHPIITNEMINFLSISNVSYENIPDVYFGIFTLGINSGNIFSTDPYFNYVQMIQTGIPVTNSKIVNFARILYLLRDTIKLGGSYNNVSLSTLTITMLYNGTYNFLYTYDSTTDTGYNLCKNILNIEDLSTDIFGSTSMATLGNYSNSSGSYQRIIHNEYYLTIDLNTDYTKNLYIKKKGQSSYTETMNNKELNPLTYNGSKVYWNRFSKVTSSNYTKAPGNVNICQSNNLLPTGVPNQFYTVVCPVETGLFEGSDTVYNCNKTSLEWESVSNGNKCSRTHCGPLSLPECPNGETLDKTPVGETASRSCGNMNYIADCTDLGWSNIKNETTGETLDSTVSLICKGDSTFTDTPAGSTATANCPENYSGTMSRACLLVDNEAVWESQINTLNCLATKCVPDSMCPNCPVTNVNEVAEYTMFTEVSSGRYYKNNYNVKCTPKGWGPIETVSYSRACPTAVFSDTVQYNGVIGVTHTFDCEDGGKYEVECSKKDNGVYTWVEKSKCENIKVPVELEKGEDSGDSTSSPGFYSVSHEDISDAFGIDEIGSVNQILKITNILAFIKNNITLVIIIVAIVIIIIVIIYVIIKTFASN